jgi:hypothetical protein
MSGLWPTVCRVSFQPAWVFQGACSLSLRSDRPIRIGGLVVSAALGDKRFYEFARAEHALWVSADLEWNLPKLQKIVPMRPARRAQR